MIRLGILGCGRVVQNRYVEVFQKELTDIKVTLVCDKVKKKADAVADSLGCKAVYSEETLLSSKEVDIVLICTESGKHYSHSLAALEASKHVIVEKPPALIPNEIIELEQIAKKKQLMLLENTN